MPSPKNVSIDITVEPSYEGTRLDQYLYQRFPELFVSRAYATRVIRTSQLSDDQQRMLKPATRLKAGMRIHGVLHLETPPQPDYSPQPGELPILYADSEIIVVNKPAGLVVHPGRAHWNNTLLNRLLYHFPDLQQMEDYRFGLVHRLDKDTSGVLIIARTRHAHVYLTEAFAQRRVKKIYHAIVWGVPPWKETEMDAPIGRDPRNRLRFTIVPTGGKPARTHFRYLHHHGNLSCLQIEPFTGRTHQIRVHLAAMNLPILGDTLYGGWTQPIQEYCHQLHLSVPRMLLHASQLTIPHPKTHTFQTFRAEFPDAFRQVWNHLTETRTPATE